MGVTRGILGVKLRLRGGSSLLRLRYVGQLYTTPCSFMTPPYILVLVLVYCGSSREEPCQICSRVRHL